MRNKYMILIMVAVLIVPFVFSSCSRKHKQQEEQVAYVPPAEPQMTEEQLRAMERARALKEAFSNDMVHFDFNKYNIRSDAAEILQRKAEYMQTNTNLFAEIQGHCDERGSQAYNMALGDRRAHASKKYMMDLGIDGNRMTTVSYGEEMPLDPAHNEYAWALNRRAQFVITAE